MTDFTWKPIKLVRDRMGRRELVDPEVQCRPVDDREEHLRLLVAKLFEECVEYAQGRSFDELVDVFEVVRALAIVEHESDVLSVMNAAARKSRERGGFEDGVGLFVKVVAR